MTYIVRSTQYHPVSRCLSCLFSINNICDNIHCKQHYRGFTSCVAYCPDFVPNKYISPSVSIWSYSKLYSNQVFLGITVPPQTILDL